MAVGIFDSGLGGLTVWDAVRRNLGEGWEEALGVGALLKRDPRDIYPATCAVTEEIHLIVEGEKEREKAEQIAARLDEMDLFVKFTRERVEEYRQPLLRTIRLCKRRRQPSVLCMIS